MRLYSYWRSTTSYRVRLALNLKGIAHEIVPVDLLAGEQRDAGYEALNPIGGVPSLVLDDGTALTQSMAILRYLDRVAPTPSLLPDDPLLAARVEAAALVVATDIHPMNNLKVVNRLKALGHGKEDVIAWMNHWMRAGLLAFASLLPKGESFCFGEAVGLADLCLVPQLYNARRWRTDMSGLDRLLEIEGNCLALDGFDAARPENQPDAPKG